MASKGKKPIRTTTTTRSRRLRSHYKTNPSPSPSPSPPPFSIKSDVTSTLSSSSSLLSSTATSSPTSIQASGCCTPKSEKSRIPEMLTCPPAPKKQKVGQNCALRRRQISFFAPQELELFFVLSHAHHNQHIHK